MPDKPGTFISPKNDTQLCKRRPSLPIEKRIAHILKKLCEKFGEHHKGDILLHLPLSRKDLADMAGTSTETASRIMSRFHQNGIITSGRQWVAITVLDALSGILRNS